MTKPLRELRENKMQIWTANLDTLNESLPEQYLVLSEDEKHRANRFKFPIHRQRFITARCVLRKILSNYLNLPAQSILFCYNEYGKPFIDKTSHNLPFSLQFNLSHTENMALYAFTLNQLVGIDIEKIQQEYYFSLIERFFNPTEINAFMKLQESKKAAVFYRLWARKEAVIKAMGKGLFLSLDSFSVALDDPVEEIEIEKERWTLVSFPYQKKFHAAAASNQAFTIQFYEFT